MKNLRLLLKPLIIILSLSLFACMPKEEKSQIRIVDLQGKARKVTTRYPELNLPALNSQGKAYEKSSQGAFTNSIKVSSSPTYVKKAEPVQEVLLNQQNQQQDFVQTQDGAASVPEGLVNNTEVANGVVANKLDEVVEYNLGNEEVVKKPENVEQKQVVEKKNKSTEKSKASGKYFVQVGSFSNEDSANKLLDKMQKFHSGKVQISTDQKTLYRVWLGPFSTKAKARGLVQKITSSGSAAILVTDK